MPLPGPLVDHDHPVLLLHCQAPWSIMTSVSVDLNGHGSMTPLYTGQLHDTPSDALRSAVNTMIAAELLGDETGVPALKVNVRGLTVIGVALAVFD